MNKEIRDLIAETLENNNDITIEFMLDLYEELGIETIENLSDLIRYDNHHNNHLILTEMLENEIREK